MDAKMVIVGVVVLAVVVMYVIPIMKDQMKDKSGPAHPNTGGVTNPPSSGGSGVVVQHPTTGGAGAVPVGDGWHKIGVLLTGSVNITHGSGYNVAIAKKYAMAHDWDTFVLTDKGGIVYFGNGSVVTTDGDTTSTTKQVYKYHPET
jgi:hypothetical protein